MATPMKITVEVNGVRAVFQFADAADCELEMRRDVIDITPPGAEFFKRKLGDTIHLLIKADIPEANFAGWQPIEEAEVSG